MGYNNLLKSGTTCCLNKVQPVAQTSNKPVIFFFLQLSFFNIVKNSQFKTIYSVCCKHSLHSMWSCKMWLCTHNFSNWRPKTLLPFLRKGWKKLGTRFFCFTENLIPVFCLKILLRSILFPKFTKTDNLCSKSWVYDLRKSKHSDNYLRLHQLCPVRKQRKFFNLQNGWNEGNQNFHPGAEREKTGLEKIVQGTKHKPVQFHNRLRGAKNACGWKAKSNSVHWKTG